MGRSDFVWVINLLVWFIICHFRNLLFPLALLALPANTTNEVAPNTVDPATQVNTVSKVGVDVSVSVDVNVLIGTISGLINSAANRQGWVKSVMEAAAYAGDYRYNVMVLNLNNGYTYSFGDIVFYRPSPMLGWALAFGCLGSAVSLTMAMAVTTIGLSLETL
jgi:hypothetical protein